MVDLVTLQHVLHQRPAAGHHQLPLRHAEVGFDDCLLRRVQSPVRFEDDRHLDIPVFILLARVRRLVEQVWLPTQAAEDEVAILAVLFAVSPHVPAHAGVDKRVRGDEAHLHVGGVEGHVFGFQAQAFTAGLEQGAQHFRANRPVRHFQHPGMRIGQCQPVDVRGPLIVLIKQVQVGAGAVVDEQRLELLAWYIALELLVICQVFGRMFGDVGIDVLRRLLAADAKALHQVARGQPAFPPGNGLDQTIAKCQVPAYLLDGLLAFHTLSMCAITLPV
ncbi:hypothetical protein D3C76_576500 [compost metagenome]